MKPLDRWIFLGVVVFWTLACIVVGYGMGTQTCAGLSFGFY